MSIIVSKFGGSSTSNAERLKRVESIINADTRRRYIILSAPGSCAEFREKITNLLYSCYDLFSSGADFSSTFKMIIERYCLIARELNIEIQQDIWESELIKALNTSMDCAASRGEFLCAHLFSSLSGIPMTDAANLIFFQENGLLDHEKTFESFASLSLAHHRAVIPGFYGTKPDGSIHTFSRNGSDISGALAAAGTGAEIYENWTDVDGFMTADPSIVPDARLNPKVSYRQMWSFARAGAQVLHPECLEPVARANIPTNLRNTMNPDHPGTMILNGFDSIVPCVTGKPDYLYLPEAGFNHETRNRLTFIPHNLYMTNDGEEIALAKSHPLIEKSDSFIPAACISTFGMTKNQQRAAIRLLSPMASIDETDHFKMLVPPDEFQDAVRTLHGILMNNIF